MDERTFIFLTPEEFFLFKLLFLLPALRSTKSIIYLNFVFSAPQILNNERKNVTHLSCQRFFSFLNY
jgi:hypothetical protein